MIISNKDKCTGCGACFNACPKNCIVWEKDDFGFLYPVVTDSCVQCNICDTVCPIDKPIEPERLPSVFAAVHRDKEIVRDSSSGGVFSAIAQVVLSNGGIVYGAAMTADQSVQHMRVDNIDGLAQLRGSKYVQSDLNSVFLQVEDDLNHGMQVLFCGLPCQVSGLKGYLRKDYSNLYTVDLICHGVASQDYFKKSLTVLGENISDFKFRSKYYVGWSASGGEYVLQGKNGKAVRKPYYEHSNYYYHYYMDCSIFRESCYTCKYASLNRVGDITLGDFWGIESKEILIDYSNGCSLVLINSQKGSKLFNSIHDICVCETSIENATSNNGQLVSPSRKTMDREERLKEYISLNSADIQKKYFAKHLTHRFVGFIKVHTPAKIRSIVRKYRRFL